RRSWTSSTRQTTPRVRSRSTGTQGRCDEDSRRADASMQRDKPLRLLIAFRSCRLMRQHSRRVCSMQMPLPKRWSLPTMSGRNTIFTGTPPRSATWTGPRSPIRSDATKERTSFGSRQPNRAVRFLTGSSTPSGTCHRSRELCAPFPEGSFLVGLSSVHWREAWKYGERAFRYCQHDAGHALATLRIAAAALGWGLVLLDGMSDRAIAALFGLSRADDYGTAEREEPELLALVTPGLPSTPSRLVRGLTAGSIGAQWCGEA